MFTYFLVALGSGLGGLARFALSGCVAYQWGESFPWGTLLVNVTGSFLIGFFATLTEPGGRVFVGGNGRQFFMTGLMGGFTTFSSFSLQTLTLARDGEWFHAGANTLASLALCLFAVWLGHVLAAVLTARH